MDLAKKKAIYCNSLILSGLVLSGTGLFFWVGIGPALLLPGVVFAGLGIYGAVN